MVLANRGAVSRAFAILAIVAGIGLALLALLAAGFVAAGGARAYAIRNVSRRVGHPVHVDGVLSFSPGLTGLTVRFSRLRVDQPAWAGPGAMIQVNQGLIKLPWTVLLGDGRLEDLQLDGLALSLKRDAQGRANWTGDRTGKPPQPPSADHIAIRNGRLDYQDLGRSISFQGELSASSTEGQAPQFVVDGKGRSGASDWSGALRSTTQIGGRKTYAFNAHLALVDPSGGSVADFTGTFSTRNGGRVEGQLTGRGPDLHVLAHLTNVSLPRTPAYQLQTRVTADAKKVTLVDLSGRIGQSDVAGTLAISPDTGGRRLEGDLRSHSLRISDLLAVVSGGQLTRSPKQPGGLLPNAAINATPLRKLSGAIHYSADSVQSPTTPNLRSLQASATFDHGLVGAAPMVMQLDHGRMVIHFMLDVRGQLPRIRFDVDLQHADTADFIRGAGAAPLQATFDGQVRLEGSGTSLAQAAAHASGEMALHVLSGRLEKTQASVLSANLLSGADSVLRRSNQEVELTCAIARFQVADGEARVTHLRMVTDVGAVSGYGGFNLGTQTIDLTLRPGATTVPDLTAVHIEGALAHPRATLSLDDPTTAMRSALGRLLHPAGETSRQAARCE